MRMALVAVFILIAGAAAAIAQPGRPYEVYIFEPREGAEVYAFAGPQRAVAFEVRGCGDVSFIAEPALVLAEMRARRRRDDLDMVHIEGRNSRVELGGCDEGDEHEEDYEEPDTSDTLVVIDNLNAGQMRRIVRSFDSAPEATRTQMLAQLGL
jgi:hypothetical protein